MKIPNRFLDQHFDELIAMALAILRRYGVQNLIIGDITEEMAQVAKDLVNTTLIRLLKANGAPPASDAAWFAFLYGAFGMDALSVRRDLVRKRNKTVRIDAGPKGTRPDEGTARTDTFDSLPPKDFIGEDLLVKVVAQADAIICRLMKEGFITPGEGAEDFRVIIRNYLRNPDQKFSEHLFDVVCSRKSPLNAKTANRWWIRVQSILASEFAPVLRPAHGAK